MHRKFLMGIQWVRTIIYKNHVGENLVYKHKKIKIWHDGRTDPLQSISKSAATDLKEFKQNGVNHSIFQS